jgi:hypothetical protein
LSQLRAEPPARTLPQSRVEPIIGEIIGLEEIEDPQEGSSKN